MTKKKSLILIFILLIFVLLSTYLGITLTKRNNTNVIYKENAKTDSSSSMFAIMIETEAGSGKYQQSTSNGWPGEGYIFNEQMSSCENGGELSWNEELGAVNLKTNTAEKCYVYFDKEVYLADYIINNVYVEDGVNGIYYHDGQGTYTNADLETGDNSYRYAGANLNNYVCFGSDEATCPEDNLYRIIGVFGDEVKLIKADYANSNLLGSDGTYSPTAYIYDYNNYKGNLTTINGYYWNNETNTNNWSDSNFNKLNLNENYLSNIGKDWSSKILNHNWKVGGVSFENTFSSLSTAYTYEVGLNSSSTTYNAKIGLMYISDYGYAASPENWTTTMMGYGSAISSNWMYMGLTEWTITRESDEFGNPETSSETNAYFVDETGFIFQNKVYDFSFAVRPCFYLNSDVIYISGDGSQENPFRIE